MRISTWRSSSKRNAGEETSIYVPPFRSAASTVLCTNGISPEYYPVADQPWNWLVAVSGSSSESEKVSAAIGAPNPQKFTIASCRIRGRHRPVVRAAATMPSGVLSGRSRRPSS